MYYYAWREVPMTASLSMATEQKEIDMWDVVKIMKTKEEYQCWLCMPKPTGFKYRFWDSRLVRWYFRNHHGMNTSWVISNMSKERFYPVPLSKYEFDLLDAVDIPHAKPSDFITSGPR